MTSPPLFPNARGQPGFVLTVSVGLVWVLRNRTPTAYPYDVVGALIRTAAIVPESWMVDLADAVVEAEQQGLITSAQATAHLAVLSAYPIFIDHKTHSLAWSDILALARRHGISARDAAYLELALRLNLPLATTDATLIRVAGAAGVSIFTP